MVISDFLNKDFNRNILFKKESGFLRDTYTAKFKYKLNTADYYIEDENSNVLESIDNTDEEDISSEGESYNNLIGEMEFSFNIKLPYKALSNNASEVSKNGRNLKWNIVLDEEKDIEFKFCIYNMTNVLLLGGGIILLFVVLIILIIIIRKKRSSKDTLIHKDYDPSIENIINASEGFIDKTPAEEQVVNNDNNVQ